MISAVAVTSAAGLLHRLFLRVFADNAQAIASYEKAGFVREAYLKEDVCIDGQFRDIVLMAVLAADAENFDLRVK